MYDYSLDTISTLYCRDNFRQTFCTHSDLVSGWNNIYFVRGHQNCRSVEFAFQELLALGRQQFFLFAKLYQDVDIEGDKLKAK